MLGLLGSKLKKARTELGLSQAAFARALGFSSEFISLLEADKRAPSLTALNKIAVSFAAMLRKVREMGFVSAAQFEDFIKRDPDSREREVFGARAGERASPGRPIYSDRYKLLQLEAAKKKKRALPIGAKSDYQKQ